MEEENRSITFWMGFMMVVLSTTINFNLSRNWIPFMLAIIGLTLMVWNYTMLRKVVKDKNEGGNIAVVK